MIVITVSEWAAMIIIWVLTAVGCFFGIRAYLRKRRGNKH